MSLSTSLSSADLLVELFDLLQSFEQETKGNELRRKVQALVPIHDMLVALGRSLIPPEIAASARGRLLHYFQKYPLTALPRKELQIVAGIDEWARRVRELRVEHGWAIITGQTAKQMYADGEFPLPDVDIASMHKDDYILISIDRSFSMPVAVFIRPRTAHCAPRWPPPTSVPTPSPVSANSNSAMTRTACCRPTCGDACS